MVSVTLGVEINHYFRLGKIKVPQQYVNTLGLDQTKQESDMTNFTRNCKYCSTDFQTIYETKIYCDRRCKERAQQSRRHVRKTKGIALPPSRIRRGVVTRYIKWCKNCNEVMNTHRHWQLYCDTTCSQMFKETRARQGQVKRFKKASAPNIVARLYYKYDGLCGICKETIDLTLKHPNRMSLSIDHILPISKGGNNFQNNLQPTHLICNMLKSDKITE